MLQKTQTVLRNTNETSTNVIIIIIICLVQKG